MGWKIIFAPQALEELEQIVRFIAHDDAGAVVRFGDYLANRAESLVNFSELGTSYRRRANIRRLLCKSYYIYYRIQRKERVIDHGLLAFRATRPENMNIRLVPVAETASCHARFGANDFPSLSFVNSLHS